MEKETVPTTYEEEKTLPINAVYGSKDQDLMVTYTSGEYGLKETLTLNEKPESNEFSYQLNLQGLTARKNVTDGGITLYDKESGEIAGAISPPWMDDASGNAYSEAITYELKENAGREGEYVLTMTADETYLADPDRKYPVTIDPSTTWKGSSEIRDAYIIKMCIRDSAKTAFITKKTNWKEALNMMQPDAYEFFDWSPHDIKHMLFGSRIIEPDEPDRCV